MLKKYIFPLEDFDDDNRCLLFRAGKCSLKEYLDELQKHKSKKEKRIDTNLIKYIFKNVAELIIMLHSKDIYHTDIKPDNMEFE